MFNSRAQLRIAALSHIGICMLSYSVQAKEGSLWSPLRHASTKVEFVATDDQPMAMDTAGSRQESDCKPIIDAPLWELSVDTQPVDQRGQIELEPNWTPATCPAPVMAHVPSIYMGMNSTSVSKWPIWPGAEFCHRPLYFEETCAERCGRTQCCQPAVSAAHFFCNAALLPIRACQHPFGGYQCTPPAF